MSGKHKNQHYRTALDDFANSISHRFRRPICTMLGLLELIQHGSLKDEEMNMVMKAFKSSLDELDGFTRELGLLIYREQQRV